MIIKSPITDSTNTVLDKIISANGIIAAYKSSLNIDVSEFFKDMDTIYIYKCLDSDYRFYYPFNITGDGKFYEKLQQFDWYYMDWKWEHETAKKIIKHNDKVLEIGCARGEFINNLSKAGIDCVGLELNEKAAKEGMKNGNMILNESIHEHAEKNKLYYDVVCSFQVAEHIPDVKNYIQSSLDSLKPDGLLIISVPNMSSFYKYFEQTYLNVPPHHMGLWDENSLKKIELFFPVKFLRYYYEPLQKYHIDNYASVMTERLRLDRFGYVGKRFLNKIAFGWFTFIGLNFEKVIKGLTIIAVFQKKN